MYTKGEWKARQVDDGGSIKHYGYEDGFITIEPSNMMGRPIATIPLHHHSIAEIQANAHLIAQAPRMYEALEWGIEELERLAPIYGDTAYSIITVLNGAKLKAKPE